MNRTETVLLCRYAKAMCPAQQIDEYTPDAWADVLHDVTLEEAKAAIVTGIRNHKWRFIDVTDVVDGVRHLRRGRIDEWTRQFGPILPPVALNGDPAKEREWLVTTRRRILDGEVTHPHQLGQRPDPDYPIRNVAELGQIGRTVPPLNGAPMPADFHTTHTPKENHR